jgi:hypothetical protein
LKKERPSLNKARKEISVSDDQVTIDKIQTYSTEIRRFINDLGKEYEDEVSDGLLAELSKKEDENDVFNFMKSQGYNITYGEFETYYNDAKKLSNIEVDHLETPLEEAGSSELSDDTLESVSGGINASSLAFKAGMVAVDFLGKIRALRSAIDVMEANEYNDTSGRRDFR